MAHEVTYPGSPEGEHIPLFLRVRSPRRTEPSRVYLMLFKVPPPRFSLLRLMLQRRRLLIRRRGEVSAACTSLLAKAYSTYTLPPPDQARAGSKQASKIQQMSSRGENFHHVTAGAEKFYNKFDFDGIKERRKKKKLRLNKK